MANTIATRLILASVVTIGILALVLVPLLVATSADEAAFFGASGKIVFATARDGNFEIYSMNADGTDQMNLTNFPSADDGHPSWSPDGTQIAFDSNRDGNTNIYIMNADGD